jgi:hypothetical protein
MARLSHPLYDPSFMIVASFFDSQKKQNDPEIVWSDKNKI